MNKILKDVVLMIDIFLNIYQTLNKYIIAIWDGTNEFKI